jgi:hypothetical protein
MTSRRAGWLRASASPHRAAGRDDLTGQIVRTKAHGGFRHLLEIGRLEIGRASRPAIAIPVALR